ncbi:ABC transporter permease [Bacillus alkalicola]|uniref:ABC transporter permease n=1 Tax=Evansella alkalicola TaxID=745819 RepID=A0ABS6JYL5_9BACI|nr:ABC transporter permease [Bacillus alkalicola]MBU9723181.1 ABC transporter permease [Bacillus alkalicola]
MTQFIIQRIYQTVIVLFILSLFCFLLIHMIPGNPVLTILGDEATPEEIRMLTEELGLDRPLPMQYLSWLGGVVQGDLGTSIIYREDVKDLILKRLPPTVHIGITSFIISIVAGVPLGVIAAVKRGGWIDGFITTSSNFSMAIPNFWLGILGIYLFALNLGWLPVQGYVSPTEDFWASQRYVIMPSLVLGLSTMAILARQARSSMLEVIRPDYIRTAISKGIKTRVVIRKHALKNAIIPVVTIAGLMLPNIVGGSVIIEQVFNVNGIGRLVLQSVFNQDIVVVQGCLIVLAIAVAAANLLVDLSYGYFDPRIRYK